MGPAASRSTVHRKPMQLQTLTKQASRSCTPRTQDSLRARAQTLTTAPI
jgi:hypothetical protein